MKKNTSNNGLTPPFLMSGGIFLTIVTLVHLLYESVIRPAANALVAVQGSSATTNFIVILKDFEQELCISIGIYCCFLIVYKYIRLVSEEPIYTMDFLSKYDKSEPIDVDEVLSDFQNSQYSNNSALSAWISCIKRYKATGSVQNVSDSLESSMEKLAYQLEAENSTIKYLIWAIPSIGFVGTVRGIGQALANADAAKSGDIAAMVDKLGVAFNSTLVSLILSIILTWLLYALNRRQDEMVLKTQNTCESSLLDHFHK